LFHAALDEEDVTVDYVVDGGGRPGLVDLDRFHHVIGQALGRLQVPGAGHDVVANGVAGHEHVHVPLPVARLRKDCWLTGPTFLVHLGLWVEDELLPNGVERFARLGINLELDFVWDRNFRTKGQIPWIYGTLQRFKTVSYQIDVHVRS